MGLRSHRMLGFSPIVIWMRRWVYSIVYPSYFTIRGPGATSSTTSRPCCANRYTADWLVMKMSTMPIVYLLIRLCEGSPGKRSTGRMPPAPTRWVDLRPRCCPSRTTSKPFRKSMADGLRERWRKPLIDASFWIWTVQQVLSMASKKPLGTTPFRMHLLPSPVLLQPVRRLRRFHASARQRAQCGPLEGDAGTNRGSVREEESPQILPW